MTHVMCNPWKMTFYLGAPNSVDYVFTQSLLNMIIPKNVLTLKLYEFDM